MYKIFKILFFIVFSLLLFSVCVIFGNVDIFSNNDLVGALSSNIILNMRIPRVLYAALIGASLSVCGVAMQGLLKNPLADGTTLGVSSFGSLGAVFAIVVLNHVLGALFQNNLSTVNVNIFSLNFRFDYISTIAISFIFSLSSLFLILIISRIIDKNISTNTVILLGVVFNLLGSSLITLLITLYPQSTQSVTFWLMGSVSGSNYANVVLLFIVLCICMFIFLKNSKNLEILSIGSKQANSLGVDVKKTTKVIIVTVSVLISFCVSTCGVIGFVGLVVPHIARRILGPANKNLFFFSAVFGADFLIFTDLISRVIITPRELPIGIITSIIGCIVFVLILFKNRVK